MITARAGAGFRAEAVIDEQFSQRSFAQVKWKILPLLIISYGLALIDLHVIGSAKRVFMDDLGVNDALYEIGAGMFFFSYILFEMLSNFMLRCVDVNRLALAVGSAKNIPFSGSDAGYFYRLFWVCAVRRPQQ